MATEFRFTHFEMASINKLSSNVIDEYVEDYCGNFDFFVDKLSDDAEKAEFGDDSNLSNLIEKEVEKFIKRFKWINTEENRELIFKKIKEVL